MIKDAELVNGFRTGVVIGGGGVAEDSDISRTSFSHLNKQNFGSFAGTNFFFE
jgi:hypothetical protein